MAGLAGLAVLATVGAAESDCPNDAGPALSLRSPRVVVLKSRRVLYLFDGDTLVRSYPVDLGRVPAGPKALAGDGRTPTGAFRLVWKNPASPYHRFLGLDYPDAGALVVGLSAGLISEGEAACLARALSAGDRPNWTTALGGGVGIHGLRQGRDWTGGCIALSDRHVEELYNVLRIGDPVEILP